MTIPNLVRQEAAETPILWERVNLDSTHTGSSVISDFSKTLVVGKTYAFSLVGAGNIGENDGTGIIQIKDGATVIAEIRNGNRDATAAGCNWSISRFIYTVADGSITVESSDFGTNTQLNSGSGFFIEELPNHENTTF